MLQSLEDTQELDTIARVSLGVAGAVVIGLALALILLSHLFFEKEEVRVLGDVPPQRLAQLEETQTEHSVSQELEKLLESLTEDELRDFCSLEGVECHYLDEEYEEVMELEEKVE